MQEHEEGKAAKETGLQTCLEEIAGDEQRGGCTRQMGKIAKSRFRELRTGIIS